MYFKTVGISQAVKTILWKLWSNIHTDGTKMDTRDGGAGKGRAFKAPWKLSLLTFMNRFMNVKPHCYNHPNCSQHQELSVKYTGKNTMAVNQKISLNFKKPILSKQVANSSAFYNSIKPLVLLKVTTTDITWSDTISSPEVYLYFYSDNNILLSLHWKPLYAFVQFNSPPSLVQRKGEVFSGQLCGLLSHDCKSCMLFLLIPIQ